MNKYAIITGVSSGIGECIAENFIKEGICVFGIDKNKPNNNEIEYFKCDIRNEEEIINIINEIKKKTEKLFLFAAESDIIKYIETIQAFLPYLIYWNDMTASLLHNTAGISNTRMISIVTRF